MPLFPAATRRLRPLLRLPSASAISSQHIRRLSHVARPVRGLPPLSGYPRSLFPSHVFGRLLSTVPRYDPESKDNKEAGLTAIPLPSHSLPSQGPAGEGLGGVWQMALAAVERWFSKIPKGFGNFYPEGDSKEQKEKESDSKAEKEESKEDKEEEKYSFNNMFGGGGGGGGQGDGDKGSPRPSSEVWLLMALGLIAGLTFISSLGTPGQEISFQEFVTRFLETGEVERIRVVNKSIAYVIRRRGNYSNAEYSDNSPPPLDREYYFNLGSVEAFERRLEEIQKDMGIEQRDFVPVQFVNEVSGVGTELLRTLPTLILIAGIFWFLRSNMGGMSGGAGGNGRNIFSIGKANPTVVTSPGKIKTRFKDVAGLDEAKIEIMEFVSFLRDPKRFTKLGAKIPKGALLVGPPGTGKTLLAKATAGESNVPFYSMSGSDFIEMFVGVGPSRVRDLFSKARQNAPCIVFIDEIDAVGRSRSKGGFSGGNDERENTLNQLLVEMDGFKEQTGVVVLAGTNRADILDSALLRPGRFDRQILVDKPDINGRRQIFEVHLKPLTLKEKPEYLAERLAALTPGFAGADIANLCNEAAIIAARHKKDAVELVDFEQATDRVIGGLEKKNKVMSKHEKELVAHHEAGHAVVGWFLEHADPLLKVTIIPRGAAALGYAQYLPKEVALYNPDQLLDRMCMALGGRAAEQIFYNKISTGASDDLKRVSQMAYAQVSIYGFSKRVGQVSFQQEEGSNQFQKPYSEQTAEIIDQEVREMIDAAYVRTLQVLEEHKEECKALALKLLDKETINHDDIVGVLGDRPFETDAYQEYLRNTKKQQEDFEKELEELNKADQEDKKGEEKGDENLQPGLAMDGEAKPEPR